jgi:lysozyme
MKMWSDLAIFLIKKFEGCSLTAYPDPATGSSPWTIGYGATGPNINQSTVWTQDQCDNDLETRVNALGAQIDGVVDIDLTDSQKAALCSFAYNLGFSALRNSTLLRLINQRDMQGAAAEFPKWDMASGKVMQGLLNRRIAEQQLFLGNQF